MNKGETMDKKIIEANVKLSGIGKVTFFIKTSKLCTKFLQESIEKGFKYLADLIDKEVKTDEKEN